MPTSETIPYNEESDERAFTAGDSPYLALMMESQHPLASGTRFSLVALDEVMIGRGPVRSVERTRSEGKGLLRILLADAWMSSEHVTLVREADGWLLEDRGSKNGSFLNGERTAGARLEDGDLIQAGSTMFVFHDRHSIGVTEPAVLSREDYEGQPRALATLNPPLRHQFALLPKIARSTVPILIRGDTGTGKEVIARAIHDESGRSGAFLAINCGALPPTLVESELFGSLRGAFSGATENRPGLVRSADGGTLLLDEIAELPTASQTALLRVLQEGEVLPVGGTEPVKVDIRVVAATHQDLSALVEAGKFRKDLYSRLVGFELTLPRLRDRHEDIGLLVAELLPKIAGDRASRITFHRTATRALCSFDWPRNIRELEHALSSAVALADGDEISLEHLPPALLKSTPATTVPSQTARLSSEDRELRGRIVALLRDHHGNVSAVARELDKERVQIRRWCKRLAIDVDSYR